MKKMSNHMWKIYQLSEIGEIVGGATPSTAKSEYYGGDIPWLTPKDLSNFSGRYIERGERNITEAGLKSCSAKLLPAGTVLFSSRAPIGYVAIAKTQIATNQGFKSIIPNTDIVDSLFLYYLLCFNKVRIESMGSGTTFKEVSGTTMKGIQVSIPNLPEQRRIAGILGALDDKIELNRLINANLEAQAMALYKHWFVDGRQEDWEYMMLGDVASVTAGGDRPTICSKIETEETRVPIYSNGIDNEGLYGYTNVAIVNEPSVTISARGTIGYVCLRQKPYTPIVRLISAIPKREYISAVYLYLWAKNMNIMGTGTTQQQLTVPDFKKQKVLIPDSATMQLFNDTVEPVFALINAYKQANNVIAYTRDTLLPKLMNNTLKQCQHENVL